MKQRQIDRVRAKELTKVKREIDKEIGIKSYRVIKGKGIKGVSTILPLGSTARLKDAVPDDAVPPP